MIIHKVLSVIVIQQRSILKQTDGDTVCSIYKPPLQTSLLSILPKSCKVASLDRLEFVLST